MRKEGTLQRRFRRCVSALGAELCKGDHVKGWPDYHVYWPNGVYELVELKDPDGTLSPMQKIIHGRLRRRGHYVIIIAGDEELDEYLKHRREV